MSVEETEAEEQRASNLSAIPHFATFEGHRERLTALLSPPAPAPGLRLCVLGAGNCYDLDLAKLAEMYAEIHLVDIDEQALSRAWERQDEPTRARLVRHAPLDVSGMLDRLARWKAFQLTEEELVQHARLTSEHLASELCGPFDVVVSACILTQMQLSVLNVLSDSHRLFEAIRMTLAVTHLRTLSRLVAPGGRALLATDVSSDLIAPLKSLPPSANLHELLDQLVQKGAVFYVANPRWLTSLANEDPVIRKQTGLSGPVDVWLWRNGPERLLLVYALELNRR